jgi:hypothetical protein
VPSWTCSIGTSQPVVPALYQLTDGKLIRIPLRIGPLLEHMGDTERIYANCFRQLKRKSFRF